jgi:hypothetical protein
MREEIIGNNNFFVAGAETGNGNLLKNSCNYFN